MAVAAARRAAPRQLRWQAYDRFQQQLLAARIRPGQFVSQRELAALTGLPLGAIREVIPRLEAEGLLRTVPQRGLQIANVDVRLVRNAFQLRAILEKEAAAHFATTATDAQLDALEAAHRDVVARAARGVTLRCSTPRRRSTGACTTRWSTRSATRSCRRSTASTACAFG